MGKFKSLELLNKQIQHPFTIHPIPGDSIWDPAQTALLLFSPLINNDHN